MGEKTELPTPRKLADAREQGQVAKSLDLSSAVHLAGAMVLIWLLGGQLLRGLGAMMQRVLSGESPGGFMEPTGAMPAFVWSLAQGAIATWPIVAVLFVVVYLAHVQQVGFLFTLKPLQPNLARMNPLSGAKRMVDRKNLVKSGLSLVKVAVVTTVVVVFVRGRMDKISALPNLDAAAAMAEIVTLAFHLAAWLIAVLLIMGAADWFFQRWQHRQDLKMTKQEVKDERRTMEGDEEVKARRRGIARQIAQQRIRSAVPKANVVVTNPTHFAVAIQYDADEMAAPTVVAKGADWLAFQIRSIAVQNGVPIVEKPELARALYAAVPVGREVQPQFYQAVAEILAYVFRLEGKAEAAKARAQQTLEEATSLN